MKHQIREHIKKKIKDIPSEKKQEYSFHITQKIIEKFGHLQNRHIYIAMSDEVETKFLIQHLEQQGKKIFTPETPSLRGTKQSVSHTFQKIDIIIVPGRAFTLDNKRLGRGKGRYDTFLAQHPNIKKIGICFPQQIVKDIPIESHDVPMDEVIFS